MRNKRFINFPDDADYNTNAPSYYEDLARKNKLIEMLSKKVWEYDEELGKRFDEWDKNLEDFPEDVNNVLQIWLNDGTLDHIINDTIFKTKADQIDLENVTEQLAQKLNKGEGGSVTWAMTAQDFREQITGGNTAVVGVDAVLSENIVNGAVTIKKTNFVEVGTNLFNNQDAELIEGQYIDSEQPTETLLTAPTVFVTGFVDASAEEKIGVPVVANILTRKMGAFYDVNKQFISGIPNANVVEIDGVRNVTVPSNSAIKYVRFNGRNNISGGIQYRDTFMIVKGDVYPSSYIPYVYPKFRNDLTLNERQKDEVKTIMDNSPIGSNNPLNGKISVFLGDSISAGAGETVRTAWAGRIATKNNMDYTNYSVSGATIASETYSGSTPRTWLCRKVDVMRDDAEYVILEGGINDHINNVPLGTITSDYVTTLDETTFCGAMESLLKQCIEKYVGKKIGFIIVYKIANEHYPYGASTPQAEVYFDKVREICEKWSVPVLDLYKESGIAVDIPAVKSAVMPDGIHVNEQGYEIITPKIEAWMQSL